MKKIRVSIGPGEVAGYFSNLKTGFDELGLMSEHFLLTSNKFKYQESGYFLMKLFNHVSGMRESQKLGLKYLGYFVEFILRLVIFAYTLIKFDVYIFSGSGSFFKFYELPVLKLFRKKIIVVYLGSDARPDYLSGRYLDDVGGSFDCANIEKKIVQQIKRIRKVESYADIIVNHTATSQLFKRDFVRIHALGMPVRALASQPESLKPSKAIRIVHAPSRPLAKGSLVFKRTVEELCAEGIEIEYVELIGVPNAVVLKELANCDFVLDELYSDTPMAMLATEAAMFSKPVIVGGYYAGHYCLDNPSTEYPVSLYVTPTDIKKSIIKLIQDKEFRLNLGSQANTFVNRNWNVRQVAQNYLSLFDESKIPENWRASPGELSYFWGWGLSKEQWTKQLKKYVNQLGPQGFYLEHNPKLRDAILKELNLDKYLAVR